MDSEQAIRVGFGSVNLKYEGAKFSAFRLKEPFLRDSAASTGRSSSQWGKYPVSMQPAINGTMYSAEVTHKNGTILLLQSSWTRSGISVRDGAILLRLREGAALLNIEATLPHGRDSMLGDRFSVFRGYADILSADEAKVFKIVTPHTVIDKFFDLDQISECFDIKELRPEALARPEVQLIVTATGSELREIQSAPQRRLNFRK